MPESQGNVIGVKFSGRITTREYEETIIPRLEAVLKEHGKARLMYVVDEGFEGAEAGAVWDDTKLGIKHRHDFEKLALVGGAKWMEWLTKLLRQVHFRRNQDLSSGAAPGSLGLAQIIGPVGPMSLKPLTGATSGPDRAASVLLF